MMELLSSWLLLCSVAMVAGSTRLRKIPIQPKFDANIPRYAKPEDEATFHPNFVIANFAGTRDARYITEMDKVHDALGTNDGGIDYSSFYEDKFISISGGENVLANEAKFTGVYGLAANNHTRDVFITDYCIIRRVDVNGIISVYAGAFYDTYRSSYYDDIFVQQIGQSCGFNDQCDAKDAMFSFPYGLALDRPGNLYVADTENRVIRKIDAVSKQVSVFAGQSKGGIQVNDDSVGLDSHLLNLEYPVTITVGGNFLYYLYARATIIKINLQTSIYEMLIPVGFQAPEYGSMWADPAADRLYYCGESPPGEYGIAFFDTRSQTAVQADYSTIVSQDNYRTHAVTGDANGDLYWSSSKLIEDSNGKNLHCRLTYFKKNTNEQFVIAGDTFCGFPEVGSPSFESRIMPAYYLAVHFDGSLLFAQYGME
ncbi:hypothetical protein EON64_18040, partial [archaeon]